MKFGAGHEMIRIPGELMSALEKRKHMRSMSPRGVLSNASLRK